ncbi:TlpA family protein disulfide reductase [Chryseobacterium aquaticum]|uniref:TlpA family protein disulfide reductase n=2 Tax=Chryseobacterium group TaxID=2782232 RepID=A0A848N9P5_9FLAO|nr:TlpA family protein disulfide reductase [Chryseobacterium aquaticum]NRQ47858.1 TlpA family protein disulfide reductase [Chryseobacterium sp. C-204]
MFDADLKDIQGNSVSLKKEIQEKDKFYVLSFWATWCAPCLNELDSINDVYQDWKKELNVEVVAISTDDSRTISRVKPLINGKGWDFTVFLDTNNDLKRKLGFQSVPYLVIVKNGEIVYTQNGYTPNSEVLLLKRMKKL